MPWLLRQNIQIHAKDKTDIWLNRNKWKHICERHKEMRKCLPEIISTLKNPEAIYLGNNDTRFAYAYSEKRGKFIIVLYNRKNKRGHVKTAYMTSNPDSEMLGMMKVYPI